MSSLSELLPSGGGQNVVSMTATGAIGAGKAVVLNSDGTVSAISTESATQGKGSTVLFESGGTSECDVVYDTYNNKIVIAYRDHGDSNAGKCVVGTVSGDSISFGTPVSFESSNSVDEMAIAYDSTNYKVLVAYNDQTNNLGKAIVGTVSGDSISFGSASQFNAATTNYPNVVYIADADKYAITYQDNGNSKYGTAVVVTVSGTTISYSSDLVFVSEEARFMDSCVQTAANDTSGQSRPRVVVVYGKSHGGQFKPHAQAMTLLSGVLYNGPENTLSSSNRGDQFAVEADPVNNRYLTVFRDEDNSDKMGAMSFGLSEDSITTKSSIVEVHGGTSEDYRIVYDANAAKLTVFYRDNSNSSKLTAIVCSDVSQSGLAFSSELVLNTSISTHLGAAYDEDTKQIVVVYRDNSASPVDGGRAIVYTNSYSSTNMVSNNVIGISKSAISNGAAGNIDVFGGIATKSDGFLSLSTTFGTGVVPLSTGAVQKIALAYDEDSYKFVMVVREGNIPYAYVGTCTSGGAITFGAQSTPAGTVNAEFYNNDSIVYDTTNNKFVLVYRDNSDSSKGKAVVGTVSGTSISWGTPVAFASPGSGIDHATISFDANAGKVLISYMDDSSAGNHAKALVGTVSGTSISFGTTVTMNASYTQDYAMAYDANAQKIVVAMMDRGDNFYGKARVATISGTDVTFGTIVTFFSSALTSNVMSATYDSTAQKVVIMYGPDSPSADIQGIVGTVSGTDITFGTATEVVNNGQFVSHSSAAYHPGIGKVGVIFNSNGKTRFHLGTVSGTDISFGSESIVDANGAGDGNDIVYIPHHTQFVVGYSDGGNSSYGTAATVTTSTDMSIGSNYYAQSDGTISTTSTSPAVLLGQAISTTTINMRNLT